MEECLLPRRYHFVVGDDAVDGIEAERARKAHVVQLHGRPPIGEDCEPAAAGESLAIDQHIDGIVAHLPRNVSVCNGIHVAPDVERGADALAQRAAIIDAVAVSK